MIIDPQPPDAPTRRWPFLLAWSFAALTIFGAILLTHAPATPEAVAVSTPPVAPATTSVSAGITVQRIPAGRSRITQYLSVSRLPQGSIIYLDNADIWIAVGPNDKLLIPPDPRTTDLW